jgi:hypothetical protein
MEQIRPPSDTSPSQKAQKKADEQDGGGNSGQYAKQNDAGIEDVRGNPRKYTAETKTNPGRPGSRRSVAKSFDSDNFGIPMTRTN